MKRILLPLFIIFTFSSIVNAGIRDVTIDPIASGSGVSSTRNINTTSPITGGGDLSADRTLAINTSLLTGIPLSTGVTGYLPLLNGGTGTNTAAGARVNLGIDVRRTFSDADITIVNTDKVIAQIGTMSASRVATLPLASTCNPGQEFVVKDNSGSVTGTNTIVITRAGSDTIDGATTEGIAVAYGQRVLYCDGVSKYSFDKGILRGSNNLSDVSSVATAKTNLSLNNVENTAISTWAGSTNLNTFGSASGIGLNIVNGTTSTFTNLYATKTDASNYAYLEINPTTTGIKLTTKLLGTSAGTNVPYIFQTSGTSTSNGFIIKDSAGTAKFTMTDAGILTCATSMIQATGNEVAYTLTGTTNKASSGNDTVLKVVQVDTASPGTSFVQEWYAGASGTTQLGYFRNDGVFFTSSSIYCASLLTDNITGSANNVSTSLQGRSFSTANLFAVTAIVGTYSQTSGTAGGLDLKPICNQVASSASNYWLRVNVTETSVGTGTQRLCSLGTGGGTYTERWGVGNLGKTYQSSLDGASIVPTNPIQTFKHSKSVADDGVVTLYAVTTSGHGYVTCGDMTEYSNFWVNSTGTVTLVGNSANVVANADTDTKLCIGTAAAQEPLQIKNRLGGTNTVNVVFEYD